MRSLVGHGHGDGHGGSDLGLGVDDRDGRIVSADTPVRGIAAIHIPLMHANSGTSQAHPVGHAYSAEFTTGGHRVLAGISTAFHDRSAGIKNDTVEV